MTRSICAASARGTSARAANVEALSDTLSRNAGFATTTRDFALSHALFKAQAAGAPLHDRHLMRVLQQGRTDWASEQASRDPSTLTTTRAAREASAVVMTAGPERWDVPRFFGMTAIEFTAASVQTILSTSRRGRDALKKRKTKMEMDPDLDKSIFQLVRQMPKDADPSEEEVSRFLKRARGDESGQGSMRLGQAIVKAHKSARAIALEMRLAVGLHAAPIWLIMQTGYDPSVDAAPAADQCVPAYWYNPEYDLNCWATFQGAAKSPLSPSVASLPATRRDALMAELSAFATWAPALISALDPTPQTARILTWMAHGFIGLAAEPEFAALR